MKDVLPSSLKSVIFKRHDSHVSDSNTNCGELLKQSALKQYPHRAIRIKHLNITQTLKKCVVPLMLLQTTIINNRSRFIYNCGLLERRVHDAPLLLNVISHTEIISCLGLEPNSLN